MMNLKDTNIADIFMETRKTTEAFQSNDAQMTAEIVHFRDVFRVNMLHGFKYPGNILLFGGITRNRTIQGFKGELYSMELLDNGHAPFY